MVRYRATVLALFDDFHERLVESAVARADARSDPLNVIFEETFDSRRLTNVISKVGSAVDTHAKKEFKRVAGITLTHDPETKPHITAFVQRNIQLIKTVAQEDLHKVRSKLDDYQSGALTIDDLSDQLEAELGVSSSRAQLIARDQVLKFNGELTKLQHTSAGIERYIWSTSGDERVREEHADLDGTEQDWDAPPITTPDGERNHPGEDIQCRCVAIPILPDV